jgi:hypothetical protein
MVIVHAACRVQLDPNETADRLLESVVRGIDDIDAAVGTIRQVILGAVSLLLSGIWFQLWLVRRGPCNCLQL